MPSIRYSKGDAINFVSEPLVSFFGFSVQTADLYGGLVLLIFVVGVMYVLMSYIKGKNNPYPFPFLDKTIKKVMMFEVDIIGNQVVATFKGNALYGSKGLYYSLTDTLYEIPSDFYLKGYDNKMRLFYKRYGKIGILPLRVFGSVISEVDVRAIEQKEKEYRSNTEAYKKTIFSNPLANPERAVYHADMPGGQMMITSMDAKMTLMLTDSYISTFYKKLASISMQTRDNFDNFLKEHGTDIKIILLAFITLLITAWGVASMIKELKGA